MRRAVLIVLWLGAVAQAHVWGQTLSTRKALGHYQQLVWQDQHGLPQNGVSSILRTRDGYLWLGTIEGAARFDGVRFVVFDNNNTPEFKSNQILSLAEDRAGSLWLGAVSGGLTRYTDGRFRLYTKQDGLSSDFVRSLLADRAGNLWIGTRGGGLNLFRDEHFTTYTTRDGLPSDQILTLAEDRDGILWIGTSNGLARFEQGRFTVYTTRDGLPHDRVNALWPETQGDSAGELWVGTVGGLCRLKQGHCVAPAQTLPPGSVTALYEDRKHNLWVGTGGNGLLLLEGGNVSQYTVRDGLPSDTVLALHQDAEGDIWVGTVDGGLCQLREGRFSVYTREDGLPHDFATAVFEDSQGSLWMGTNGGVGRLKDGTITAWTGGQSRPENDSITEDRAGNIWLSARGQLTQFRDGQFTRWTTAQGLPYEPVRELLGDHAGNLWISTPGHGLTRFREGRFRSFDTRDGLADNEPTALYESRDGQLWVGTVSGSISRFDAETQHFITWTAKDGLPGDQVLAFHADRAGSLWIGTNGGGLRRFKDGRFVSITVRDGLFDNRTFQILSDTEDDSGNLWMSSNRGIFRVSLRELNDFADGRLTSVSSVAHGVADGMLSRECNGASPAGWKTRDGRLWFPTVKGVVAIDPEQRNKQPSLVAIEGMRIDNRALAIDAWQPATRDPQSSIQLRPGQENLEIEYTGINWRRPQQIRFKYQLAGFNQDWVNAGTRRTAYFSNLPPGDYMFKVTADNGEGVWNTTDTSVRIVVLPPFYRTAWFLTLAFLSVTGVVSAAFKYRINQLQRRQAAQESFARQLIDSQEHERRRIAAELHDSLGQHLIVIKNRALLGSMKSLDGSKEQFEEISASATQSIDEVKQIAYNLRPYHLDKLGLGTSIEAMTERLGASTNIEFTVDVPSVDGAVPKDQEINVYRIVQESLNNIVKHSGATRASIDITHGGQDLVITIADNGKGFDAKAAKTATIGSGFGLAGMAERVGMLGGRHAIVSAPGQGTTVTIVLPGHSHQEEA